MFAAKFDAKKDEPTIKVNQPKPTTIVVAPGLEPLRVAISAGALSTEL